MVVQALCAVLAESDFSPISVLFASYLFMPCFFQINLPPKPPIRQPAQTHQTRQKWIKPQCGMSIALKLPWFWSEMHANRQKALNNDLVHFVV